ncbi:cytochrome P450 [Tenuibacillus multivorans]|uniref:Fatty-acid peroxygenase n=1 Tax=Tenuibacillus multivorans TaxID=237069 RepID=A0A1H0CMS9_9BACI|nr:cytochrome P450 [Tenuibacillus multivorans]GEL76235.1 fatty-acid peroxygenase [Tenuibacillus multivorans]SDN59190.1 fatty-acid peroxygenase [Tenuibacillus multivorans]
MKSNQPFPKDFTIDSTAAVLFEGYKFIQNRKHMLNSNIFQTRVMGKKVICISGEDAAELFYDNDKFQRQGAVPKRVQKSLFGVKAIQNKDGQAHQHRKELFMSLMTKDKINELQRITRNQWEMNIKNWEKAESITLYEDSAYIMCKIAFEWAGVPLKESEVQQRTHEYKSMVDSFGGVGPRYQKGKRSRINNEKWAKHMIEQVRDHTLSADEGTALHAMAWHKDSKGQLLDPLMAGKELINILRPIVAISRYVTFAALALHEYPQYKKKIKNDENGQSTKMFVHEVRRYYPFGPLLGAMTRQDFTWKGYDFKKGTLVFLDIYGTNRDSELWDDPELFYPERFDNWDGSGFDLIPQGGGDYYKNHRCPGEQVTIKVMEESIKFFVNDITYDVPNQDLGISLRRMPTLPRSGFIITNVNRK